MKEIDFAAHFTLGNVVEILTIIIGWVVLITKIDTRLKGVEKDVKDVVSLIKWRERVDERILMIRRDIDELRRGHGYIKRDIDGEYTREGRISRNPGEDPEDRS